MHALDTRAPRRTNKVRRENECVAIQEAGSCLALVHVVLGKEALENLLRHLWCGILELNVTIACCSLQAHTRVNAYMTPQATQNTKQQAHWQLLTASRTNECWVNALLVVRCLHMGGGEGQPAGEQADARVGLLWVRIP